MLTRDQVELIHREIDGENTPADSAAFRSLLEENPAARSFAAELRELTAALADVRERPPPERLRWAILGALPRTKPAHESQPSALWTAVQGFVGHFMQVLRSATIPPEGSMITKKALLGVTTAVAVVAIIAFSITGFPPRGGGEAGTIGGATSDTIAGVQQAARYRGQPTSASDVTIANPEIGVLFQNDEVLALVKSDVFREAMQNDAFRELQSNEAFRELMSAEASRELFASEAYRELMASEAYRELMSSEAYRDLMASDAYRSLESQDAFRAAEATEAARSARNSEAYRELQANEAYRRALSSEAYRKVRSNEAFRAAMSNDAFRAAMSSDAFRAVMANEAFRKVMSTDAYLRLQSAEVFRAVARSQQLSEAFLNEAMRQQR